MPHHHRQIIPIAPVPLAGSGHRVSPVAPGDATLAGGTGPALKGRGTAWAIAHRFERDEREVVDDGWGTLDQVSTRSISAPAPR
jgi:hypothetical protein